MDARDSVPLTLARLQGLPAFLVGSVVAAARYPHISPSSYGDVDIFCSSPMALASAKERLAAYDYHPTGYFERVYQRWLRKGMGNWHTNSLVLANPDSGETINLVYKKVNGTPLRSLSAVVESFDFGLLAIGGYELETGEYRDLRSYLFPQMLRDPTFTEESPLPLLPNKRKDWRDGFFSQYNGLREAGRYVKYLDYGYDMSMVKDDLLTGYWQSAAYHLERDNPEKQALGKIYESIADSIEADSLDNLRAISKEIPFMDSLDQILEALE